LHEVDNVNRCNTGPGNWSSTLFFNTWPSRLLRVETVGCLRRNRGQLPEQRWTFLIFKAIRCQLPELTAATAKHTLIGVFWSYGIHFCRIRIIAVHREAAWRRSGSADIKHSALVTLYVFPALITI
jgi:hypothetical protein